MSRPGISVIFCDLHEFAELVGGLEPLDLVDLLHDVFSMLDRLAPKYKVEKIETVAETYLAAGGINDSENPEPREVARNVVEFGWDVLKQMQKIDLPNHDKMPHRATFLEVKVGINSGDGISGIVGAKKPQYVVIGDTVNTAARMKGTGKKNHVHISKATYDLLMQTHGSDAFNFEHRRTFCKGKGELDTYLLLDYQ